MNKPSERETDLYVVDLRGDKYNLIYGTIHRYSVPAYHRIGRGSVLGLPPNYKIDRDSSDGNTIVLRTDAWRSDASRTKSRNLLSKADKRPGRLLRVRRDPHPGPVDAEKDYLSLNVLGKRKRDGGLMGSDSDDDRYGYRSIHGKAKPDEELPSDVEAVSESDSEDDEEKRRAELEDDVKQRNAELSRAVEQNPRDVAAWLRLIEHQGALLGNAAVESRGLSYAEKMSLADIKFSLYKKALGKSGDVPSRDRLLLGLLDEGSKLWDTKKLSEQWQDVLKHNSRYISLWIKYIEFRQTEFLDFTYERCMTTFLDCLKLNASSPESTEKVYIQTYLFLRLTAFMREAGFADHAVALWQAVLEFFYFRPDELSQSANRDEALSAFHEFWESEVARVGDVGAKGWKSGSNPPVEPVISTTQSKVNRESIFASWLACEREQTISARMPARSLDESDIDDPYRVVIFSDLQELLSICWGFEFKDVLLDGFLYYCRLPPLTTLRNVETTSRWNGDNFLRNEIIDNPDFSLDDWRPKLNVDAGDTSVSPVSFPHHNFIHTTDTYFAEHQSWFSSFRLWAQTALNGRSDIDAGWVRRTLRSLVEAEPTNDDLAEYALALESACDTKEGKKYGKYLLKRRSSSLRLYNAYALLECRTGNRAAAEHVWATALSMSSTFPAHAKTECALLWHTWLWELLGTRDIARASHLLLSMPQNSVDLKSLSESPDRPTFSPTSLLKTRNHLSDAQENALSARNPAVFVAYTDSLTILTYTSNSQDLNKALETYTTALAKLKNLPTQTTGTFKSFTSELLLQSRSKLLYHHVKSGNMYKPALIREVLWHSLSVYPHNTIFLSLFAWNESRFRIEGRVRDVIRDITTISSSTSLDLPDSKKDPTPTTQQVPITTHLFSIFIELTRPEYAGSTAHSIRAAFEKAIGQQNPHAKSTSTTTATATSDVSPNATAHSNLSLWKLYILFEIDQRDLVRARDVFYRALRACPWSKELVMLAFSHLRGDVVDCYSYRGGGKDGKEGVRGTAARDGLRPRRGDGMDFYELRRVYDVLVEKELRVHVDIEGVLDEMMVAREGEGDVVMSG